MYSNAPVIYFLAKQGIPHFQSFGSKGPPTRAVSVATNVQEKEGYIPTPKLIRSLVDLELANIDHGPTER